MTLWSCNWIKGQELKGKIHPGLSAYIYSIFIINLIFNGFKCDFIIKFRAQVFNLVSYISHNAQSGARGIVVQRHFSALLCLFTLKTDQLSC